MLLFVVVVVFVVAVVVLAAAVFQYLHSFQLVPLNVSSAAPRTQIRT